jgi:acyl carrier protein
MKTALIQFLSEEILTGASSPLQPGDDLLTSGLLDSLGVMQLVWFIEREFEIQVPPEDVTIDNFQSVDCIVEYLDARRVPSDA